VDVAYVAMVIHVCFKCCRLMLQVFHIDVAYVAMAILACFKHLFQVFYLFQTYVTNVLFGCFKIRSQGSTCCNCVVLLLRGHSMFQNETWMDSTVTRGRIRNGHVDQ
jgi:hypothetical protein